jgi:precorrin-6B methylase 2
MHGTVPRKIGRVVINLLSHPQYISRCLTHNLIDGKTPLDLELPWFSYAAIDFLERYLQPHMEVCEYGSGGSTVFFARRVKNVFSIEDNAQWFKLVSDRLKREGLDNATQKLCPFDFKNPRGFERSDYLNAIPDKRFDVIVVDGSEEWTQIRPICFGKAEERIKHGGIIVVDDSWRYPALRQNHHAQNYRVFQSVGPCRPGVTSTDIFFY